MGHPAAVVSVRVRMRDECGRAESGSPIAIRVFHSQGCGLYFDLKRQSVPMLTAAQRLKEIDRIMSATTVSADEFQALEQRVLRTVELIRTEREARAAAEAEVAALKA